MDDSPHAPVEKYQPRSAKASLQCLLVALVFFLAGHCAALITASYKVQFSKSEWTWFVTLSPLWVGNGAAMLFEILSIVLAAPIVKKVVSSSNPHNADFAQSQLTGEVVTLIPVVKNVANWNCCVPLLGVLPPVPLLSCVISFEVLFAGDLQGDYTYSAYTTALPLFLAEAFIIIHFLLLDGRGKLTSGVSGVAFCAFTALVAARVHGDLGSLSWWVVFLPLWVWLFAVFATLIWVLAQMCSSNGSLELNSLQKKCMWSYVVSFIFFAAGTFLFCQYMDEHAPGSISSMTPPRPHQIIPAITVPFLVSGIFFGLPVSCIAYNMGEVIARDGLRVPKLLGAGWDVDGGIENWMLLGYVTRSRHGCSSGCCVARGGGADYHGAIDERAPLNSLQQKGQKHMV